MSPTYRWFFAAPFAAIIMSCTSTSPFAPTKPAQTINQSGTYIGGFASPHASGSFIATFGQAASASRAASPFNDHAEGNTGNSITITLLNGTVLTLTGSNSTGTFTVTDSAGDSCQGSAANTLNATCTLVSLGGIQTNLLGVLDNSAATNLTMYCGIDTALLSQSMGGSIILGVAGSQSFIISIAAGSNTQTLYTGTASNGQLALTSVGAAGAPTVSIQGSYTATTATGTIAAPGTAGVVAAWGAASPCALVPITLSQSSLQFTAIAGIAPAPQAVAVLPIAAGPATAIIPANAPWLTATISGDSVWFAVSPNMPAGSYGALVKVIGQFAQGPTWINVFYSVTGVSAGFQGLFLSSSDGQLMGYTMSPAPTSNAAPAINGTTAASTGAGYLAVDSLGDLWVSDAFRGKIFEIPTSQFSSSDLNWSFSCQLPMPIGGHFPQPTGIAVGRGGTVWVADSANAGRFYGYSPTDMANTCAINPQQTSGPSAPTYTFQLAGVTGSQLSLTHAVLSGMAFDAQGNLYIADHNSGFVYKILAGQLSNSNPALLADAALNVISEEGDQSPHALAFDVRGNLWVSYLGHGSIAEFTASQLSASSASYPIPQNILTVSSVADSVTSIAFDATGNLWLVEAAHADANHALAFVPASQLSVQNAVLVPSVTFAENAAGPQAPLAIAFSPAPAGLSLGAQRVRARTPTARSRSR